MRLEGRIWKDGKYWVVHLPLLDISTQGTSAKNALRMIEDAVKVESGVKGLRVEAAPGVVPGTFTIQSSNPDALIAFALRRLRKSRGLTLREVAKRLHSASPSAYAQYEQGRRSPTLGMLRKLVQAIDPEMEPILSV